MAWRITDQKGSCSLIGTLGIQPFNCFHIERQSSICWYKETAGSDFANTCRFLSSLLSTLSNIYLMYINVYRLPLYLISIGIKVSGDILACIWNHRIGFCTKVLTGY